MRIQQEPTKANLFAYVDAIFKCNFYVPTFYEVEERNVIIAETAQGVWIVYQDGVKRWINKSFFNDVEHIRETLESIIT